MRKIAIIGGTGVYSPDALGGFEEKVIKTPYGDALCKMGSKKFLQPRQSAL